MQATVLYLDKGFCSGEIITYLQRKQGGIRTLWHGRGSFTTEYTLTDGTTAYLAMVDTRVRDHKTKRKQNPDGDYFTGVQFRIGSFSNVLHPIIDVAENVDDNVFGSHQAAPYGFQRPYFERSA